MRALVSASQTVKYTICTVTSQRFERRALAQWGFGIVVPVSSVTMQRMLRAKRVNPRGVKLELLFSMIVPVAARCRTRALACRVTRRTLVLDRAGAYGMPRRWRRDQKIASLNGPIG